MEEQLIPRFPQRRAEKIFRLYNGFKKQHPTLLLFFLYGRCYEIYYGDAFVVARYTGAPLGFYERIPVVCMPINNATLYVDRMTKNGWQIGICEPVDFHENVNIERIPITDIGASIESVIKNT